MEAVGTAEDVICGLVSTEDTEIMLGVAVSAPPGIFLEVGVYQGGTALYLAELARRQRRQLYLYDTFAGMPESTDGVDKHPVGDFADCSYETIRRLIPEAFIFKGMFPATLMPLMPPIGFAHIDCDQYESIKNCITYLLPFMAPQGIFYFDDYGCLAGAVQAVDELLPNRIILANGKAIAIV